ncbi:uncharacterized protein BO95DRAFT_427507 [Aspergillus brunneoviolaceus CBS 621.78]|uniref:Uncharacterized protein n=1 Tax=Aspergillus brunneoviolaceus CBS 621.78 TaxID=1450534 RepID=A0ACD1GN84_9EURO|nr:hypothetical protein BO95DRAFT_427507 [Aspergillus brunneoviolaceus CBS 621.78]RAH50587.1 hypothetical protein BO95DRAFT_427507 [Aspergillus brunneoviolaceus CBS 621.78]
MKFETPTVDRESYIPLQENKTSRMFPTKETCLDQKVTVRVAMWSFLVFQTILWFIQKLIMSYWYRGYDWYKSSEIGCYYQDRGLLLLASLFASLGFYLWSTYPYRPNFAVGGSIKMFFLGSAFVYLLVNVASWFDDNF